MCGGMLPRMGPLARCVWCVGIVHVRQQWRRVPVEVLSFSCVWALGAGGLWVPRPAPSVRRNDMY